MSNTSAQSNISNLQMLIDRYGKSPTLNTDHLAEIMCIKPQTVRNQFANKELPFHAVKAGTGSHSKIVASKVNVAKWLDGE